MYFLNTIIEEDESEMFLQRSLLGQQDPAQSSPQAVRRSQRLAGSVDRETDSTHSEERKSTGKPQRRGSRHSLTDLATVALRVQADLRKQYEEPVRRRSSSTPRTSRSFSGTTSPPTARRASRSRSMGRLSGPVERTNDESKATSAKRTDPTHSSNRVKQLSSKSSKKEGTVPKPQQQQRRNTRRKPAQDDFPAPQWVINLMIDIEEATQHKLTVE
ncbi:uncharacterized protein LOC118826098 [Colossoma macropomum]|uniref:uncharacterized protein LOC118826098 n=1 Tax=Colossoma macropomum TaxID=42526 RepID=UPI001863C977|nr:uncharacterized protein LOC118826098 [Colossoma macropomum]